MKFFYKTYKDKEWLGPIQCGHITFNVDFIYLYEKPLARKLLRTFDCRDLYKYSIEVD